MAGGGFQLVLHPTPNVSIGFQSRLLPGHLMRVMLGLSWNHFMTILALWHGAPPGESLLSCGDPWTAPACHSTASSNAGCSSSHPDGETQYPHCLSSWPDLTWPDQSNLTWIWSNQLAKLKTTFDYTCPVLNIGIQGLAECLVLWVCRLVENIFSRSTFSILFRIWNTWTWAPIADPSVSKDLLLDRN